MVWPVRAALLLLLGCGGGAGDPTGMGGSGPGGTTGDAGTTGASGTTGAAGTTGVGGRGGTTGVAGTTGAAGRGGTTGAAGRGGTTGGAGTTGAGGTTATCGSSPLNPNPFGCTFGWGRNNPSGSGALSSYSYLQFITYWVESNVTAAGDLPSTCSGCTWLTSRVAPTNLIPVFYAYMIGFYGHKNNLPDGNTGGPPNLTTNGAALIKANRAKIVQMYAGYAQRVAAVWPTRPLVWMLEGDFMQYADTAQTSPLTMAELGSLAADITCAIKTNMPNAVVAMNHTTWNGNDETTAFWNAMRVANLDLVWTTGVGNNGNFIESAGRSGYYNATTATYPYIHQLTGKNIIVDTSCGVSAMADTWTGLTAAQLNTHITNGVIGLTICAEPPSNYMSRVTALSPGLSSTCN